MPEKEKSGQKAMRWGAEGSSGAMAGGWAAGGAGRPPRAAGGVCLSQLE